VNLSRLKFENYLKEMFFDSDTRTTILTSASFDDKTWNFISNDPIQEACQAVSHLSGSTRMFGHAVFSPKIS